MQIKDMFPKSLSHSKLQKLISYTIEAEVAGDEHLHRGKQSELDCLRSEGPR